jgi:hypothetical protein
MEIKWKLLFLEYLKKLVQQLGSQQIKEKNLIPERFTLVNLEGFWAFNGRYVSV